jgi:hypothetical protein
LPWAYPSISSPSLLMALTCAHFLMDQPILISSQEIVSPQILSLITKTRIRSLDAFSLPLFGNWRQHFKEVI